MITPPEYYVGIAYADGQYTDVTSNVLGIRITRGIQDILQDQSAGRCIVKFSSDPDYLPNATLSNYIKYSEQISAHAWTGSISTAPDVFVAPDGELSADIISDLTSGSSPSWFSTHVYDPVYANSGQQYTASLYIRKDSTPASSRFVTFRAGFYTNALAELGTAFLHIDTRSGTTEVSSIAHAAFTVNSIGLIDAYSDYWRAYVSMRSSSNSLGLAYCGVYPAYGRDTGTGMAVGSTSAVGSAVIWGWQVNSGPRIPYARTETSSMTATQVPPIGKDAKVTVTRSGTTHSLFQGFVQNLDRRAEFGTRHITLNCYDAAQKLARTNIDTEIYTDIGVSSAVTLVCSAAKVSVHTIEAITDTIPFFWENNVSARGSLKKLLEFGHYYSYVDGDGSYHFRDRNTFTVSTAVGSYSEFNGLSYSFEESTVQNNVSISGHSRKLATSVATLAWLSNPLSIQGSSSVEFWLTYVDPSVPTEHAPAQNMVTPANSSDYKINANSGGTGTDYTSTASASVSFFGEAAKCTVFNGTGISGYITKFQLSGKSLQKTPIIRQSSVSSRSVALYGEKRFNIDSPFITDATYAKNYSDFLEDMYEEPLPSIKFGLQKNLWPDVLTRDVGDVVSLVNTHMAINSSYLITGISHNISTERGIEHRLDITASVLRTGPFLVFDHAVFGLLDTSRTLGF